jgi:hypothetical protein
MLTGVNPKHHKNFSHENITIAVADTAIEVTFSDNVSQLTIHSPSIDIFIGYTEAEVNTPPSGSVGSRVKVTADTWTVKGWQGRSVWLVNATPGETAADIYVLGEQ